MLDHKESLIQFLFFVLCCAVFFGIPFSCVFLCVPVVPAVTCLNICCCCSNAILVLLFWLVVVC